MNRDRSLRCMKTPPTPLFERGAGGIFYVTVQNNSREHLVGIDLKGFLESGDPLFIPSGFTTSVSEKVIGTGTKRIEPNGLWTQRNALLTPPGIDQTVGKSTES
jgi:hypothetical protein